VGHYLSLGVRVYTSVCYPNDSIDKRDPSPLRFEGEADGMPGPNRPGWNCRRLAQSRR